MLNTDYDPYEHLQYVSDLAHQNAQHIEAYAEQLRDLAVMLEALTNHIKDFSEQLGYCQWMCNDIHNRLQNLEDKND